MLFVQTHVVLLSTLREGPSTWDKRMQRPFDALNVFRVKISLSTGPCIGICGCRRVWTHKMRSVCKNVKFCCCVQGKGHVIGIGKWR